MISADQWRAYNEAVERLCERGRSEVASAISSWLSDHPGATVEEAREEAKRVMRGTVQSADKDLAAIAAEWYDAQGKEAGAKLDRAVTSIVYTDADVDKVARYQATKFLAGDLEGFAEACGDFAVDNAKRSLNATILKNAKRDRAKGVRFARVTSGRNTCAFCLMLAGRGAVYWTRETAGEFDRWHTHCSCKVVPSYSNSAYEPLVEGHDPKKIEARLKEVERITGTKRGTREFAREVALRDPDWLFGDSPDGVGDDGIAASALNSVGAKAAENKPSSNVVLTNEQYGKKIRKHAREWGLDPSSKDDRDRLEGIIADIIDGADSVDTGNWRDQPNPCTFYRKGDDLVIVDNDGKFVTVMRGGGDNKRYRNAISGQGNQVQGDL